MRFDDIWVQERSFGTFRSSGRVLRFPEAIRAGNTPARRVPWNTNRLNGGFVAVSSNFLLAY